MTDTRITLESLKEQFSLYEEPYNLPDGPTKLDLLRVGEIVCGSPILFKYWLQDTFGISNCRIPRDMVAPLKKYLESLNMASQKTITEWKKLGRRRYANFDTWKLGFVYFVSHKRTMFPPLMTEEEVTRMIYAWRNNPAPTPATQPPPEPFIHAPMVLCLPEPSVQVVALLPAVAASLLAVPEAINEPVITVAVHEVDIPFKEHIDRAAVGDFMGWSEEDYIKPLYTVGKPIIVEAKPPQERQPSAFFRLRSIISGLECKMPVQDRVRSRFDFFGQGFTDLNNVTLQQLADYAEHLGYSPLEVQKILADHAKKQFGDGSERRLAS